MEELISCGQTSGKTISPIWLSLSFCLSQTTNQSIYVAKVKSNESLQSLFHLPLSEEAYPQFIILQELLGMVQSTEEKDIRGFIWGSTYFSSSKVYKQLSEHSQVHVAYRWTWKSSCQNKHRVFFWLILKNRLNTRSMLRRRNMEPENFNCVLCNRQTEETIEHLFIDCPFAALCWNATGLGALQVLPTAKSRALEIDPDQQKVLHGNHYPSLLGHLDVQKQPHL